MSVRPEIEALIVAGHGNAAISAATGRTIRTIQRARQLLREGEQRGPARVLAMEELPTGQALKRRPWTPEEQARHRAELLAALSDDVAYMDGRGGAAA